MGKARVETESSQLSSAGACGPDQAQGPLGVCRPAHPQARALEPPPEWPEGAPSLSDPSPAPPLFPREATYGELCFCSLCQRGVKPAPPSGPGRPRAPQPREAGSAAPPGASGRRPEPAPVRRAEAFQVAPTPVATLEPRPRNRSGKGAKGRARPAGGLSNTPPQETTSPASGRPAARARARRRAERPRGASPPGPPWNTWELDRKGRLAFVCSGCAVSSPPRPDEAGNASQGAAWRLAVSLGWREECRDPDGNPATHGVVWVWCPDCREARNLS